MQPATYTVKQKIDGTWQSVATGLRLGMACELSARLGGYTDVVPDDLPGEIVSNRTLRHCRVVQNQSVSGTAVYPLIVEYRGCECAVPDRWADKSRVRLAVKADYREAEPNEYDAERWDGLS